MDDITYGLVFANDVVRPEDAVKLSKIVGPFVDGIKIGIATTLRSGISIINEIKKATNKIIIADFKVADIGFLNKNVWEGTNAKIVSELVECGADYVVCHSIIGISSIQECIETAHKNGGKVLTLPFMTHKGAELIFSHPIVSDHVTSILDKMGIRIGEQRLKSCHTISDVIIMLGDILGVDGYIGPANKIDILKRYRELTNKSIFGPGIGRQAIGNLDPKDQLRDFYRLCGEQSAAIIGSAIYNAPDPERISKEFMLWRDEIKTKHFID